MSEKKYRRNTASANESLEYLKQAFLISGNDSTDLDQYTRGISFSSAGTLKVTTIRGDTLVFPQGALSPGIIHPLGVKRVWLTDTTVTGIVGYV